LPGGIARPFRGTAQRKQSGVNDGRQDASAIGAQPLTASTPWHDEGNSKTASLAPPYASVLGEQSTQVGGARGHSRMAVIRHEARDTAREPDGGTPGRYEVLFAGFLRNDSI